MFSFTRPLYPAALPVAVVTLMIAIFLGGCKGFWDPLPAGTGNGTGATPTTTTLTSPNSSVSAGAGVTLTATVAPAAATGTVTFLAGNSTLGTAALTSGTATFTATFSTPGVESLTATYGGDATYAASTSSAVSLTVTPTTAAALTAALTGAGANHQVNLVLDPEVPWAPAATVHLHNLARVVTDGSAVSNIDGGHCVLYSGSVYLADGTQTKSGTYTLQGGGFLAPEQRDLSLAASEVGIQPSARRD